MEGVWEEVDVRELVEGAVGGRVEMSAAASRSCVVVGCEGEGGEGLVGREGSARMVGRAVVIVRVWLRVRMVQLGCGTD